MTIGERLRYFIESNFESQASFAKEVDSTRSLINRQIADNQIPRGTTLVRFYEAGMSIDWYLSGNGSMFASNDIGKALRQKLDERRIETNKGPVGRLIVWINKAYGTVERLASIIEIDPDELHEQIFFEIAINPLLLKKFERAGCNVNWLTSGDGSMFADNNFGKLLESKTNEQSKN